MARWLVRRKHTRTHVSETHILSRICQTGQDRVPPICRLPTTSLFRPAVTGGRDLFLVTTINKVAVCVRQSVRACVRACVYVVCRLLAVASVCFV